MSDKRWNKLIREAFALGSEALALGAGAEPKRRRLEPGALEETEFAGRSSIDMYNNDVGKK